MASPASSRPRIALASAAACAALLLGLGGTAEARANAGSDPVGDAAPNVDIAAFTARADARTGTVSAAVRLAGTAKLGGAITVRFGRRDAAGACQTAGRPSVLLQSSTRPDRNSAALWDVPGSTRLDPLLHRALQQVPEIAGEAISSLGDPALRTPLDCARADSGFADAVVDSTAPIDIGAGPLDPLVAGTAMEVDGRLGQIATFAHAHLRVRVTCLSSASGMCVGTLRIRRQRSKATAGSAPIRLASGQSRTLSVLVRRADREAFATDRPTVIATTSIRERTLTTFAELTAIGVSAASAS